MTIFYSMTEVCDPLHLAGARRPPVIDNYTKAVKMLKDRIIVRQISPESKMILYDCSIWICRNMCTYYYKQGNEYKITGDYLLNGYIEIAYRQGKYTRFQRFLIKLLEWSVRKKSS